MLSPYSIDNQIAAELHWFKVRVDQIVKRILIKHGVLPDPLAHITARGERTAQAERLARASGTDLGGAILPPSIDGGIDRTSKPWWRS